MKTASKFLIPPNWKVLFNDLGIQLHEALAYAGLPPGLFNQEKVYLTPAQYFQLWHGVEAAAGEMEIPLKLAEVMTLESFDVPIFAAICSPNLSAALHRLQTYKPLIGPMLLDLQTTDFCIRAEISCYGYQDAIPKCYALAELVFFTQIARLASRKSMAPVEVTVTALPEKQDEYEEYFGCRLSLGECVSISFSQADAKAPFLTENKTMLSFFEGELQQKLKLAISSDEVTSKVSAVLMKSLPHGESSIEYVASQLALSKRSLQRKLTAENLSYQKLLQQVRQELAEHYLTQTELPIIEVSFLLGFHESNSFIRAYNNWTGSTPAQRRITHAH